MLSFFCYSTVLDIVTKRYTFNIFMFVKFPVFQDFSVAAIDYRGFILLIF